MADELERLKTALAERYSIEREIGRGGMATVYLAHDLKLDRSVALKVLRAEFAGVLGPERFLREITLTARLDHPHILPVLDSGEADGVLFYVMPYVEGESLRDRLNREKQLPLEDVIAIAREVADALSYAHSFGIIHRDIKPENILLGAGHARVADFGIARAVSAAGGERLTETGLAVGTSAYMSPEQASGAQEVDARSDLYALGCVVYEMLVGDPPFAGSTPQVILARKSVQPAPALRPARDTIPAALEHAVLKVLARLPADRFATAAQFANALSEPGVRPAVPGSRASARLERHWSGVVANRWIVIGGILGTIVLLIGGVWLLVRQPDERWAPNVALAEAVRLLDQGQMYAAFRLLRQAERHVPDNPLLEELLLRSTVPVSVRSTPEGARVYIRDFFDDPDTWDFLGETPLDLRLPDAALVWRVSLEGRRTVEAVRKPFFLPDFPLLPAAEAHAGMVHVPGGRSTLGLLSTEAVDLEPFWIDRYEVTNREFKAFLDQGGYRRPEFWVEPLFLEGVEVGWDQSRQLFRDRTGRPGPATWEVGTYPDGQDDYPMGGISWYEAAAYCAFAGKSLPTLHQWYQAADLFNVEAVVQFSNFGADGPAPVGHPLRLGGHGTYDMAGNVKEWAWNEATEGRRYVLGGAWNEPSYQFHGWDARSPWDREPTFGVRCAKYSGPLTAEQMGPVATPFVDWRWETPVSDEVFAVYKGLYDYDPMALEPWIDPEGDEFEHWSVERVNFAAAYGNERVPALLVLPKNVDPPYQTVVYFPGFNAWLTPSPPPTSIDDVNTDAYWLLFLVRGGRAVLFPAYKGAFHRHIGSPLFPHIWRDIVIHSAKDLRRAVDYLETRPDIDADRLAHFGISSGAAVGPIMTAVEPRFQASVLFAGGALPWRHPPEVEAVNFAPRVRVPTLMINGRHDFYYPYETSQAPLFELLGTPPNEKRHKVFESAHIPAERAEVMREALDWLDRYLGPVNRP